MFLRRNPVPFKIMYKNVILKSLFTSNNFQVLYQTHQNRYDDDIVQISCMYRIGRKDLVFIICFVFNFILSYET